jgi:FKBP-type peptidyl-prolyl cis-trans isomerase SlyD
MLKLTKGYKMVVSKDCIVTLDYTINDNDGNLLHKEEEPIVYLHGDYGQIFLAVEKALEGKNVGDTFETSLSSNEAFGEYDPELVVTEKLSELPADISIGMEIDGSVEHEECDEEDCDEEEDVIIYTVTAINGDEAILDANHPLAGLDLVFKGIILDVKEASEDEIEEMLDDDEEYEEEE